MGVALLLFDVLYKTCESLRSIFCKSCKDLSVYLDALVGEHLDESAVLDLVCLKCCIDASDPESSEIILLILSVSECMQLRMIDRFSRLSLLL